MAYASVARWLTERPEGQGLAALLAGAGVRARRRPVLALGPSIGGDRLRPVPRSCLASVPA